MDASKTIAFQHLGARNHQYYDGILIICILEMLESLKTHRIMHAHFFECNELQRKSMKCMLRSLETHRIIATSESGCLTLYGLFIRVIF